MKYKFLEIDSTCKWNCTEARHVKGMQLSHEGGTTSVRGWDDVCLRVWGTSVWGWGGRPLEGGGRLLEGGGRPLAVV